MLYIGQRLAGCGFHTKRHPQLDDALHNAPGELGHDVELIFRYLEHQLVVNLEQHLGTEPPPPIPGWGR